MTQYDSIVTNRLKSSKKILLVRDLKQDLKRYPTYDDANNACKSVCGRIYFPSTMAESDEVEQFLNDQAGIHGPEQVGLRTNQSVDPWDQDSFDGGRDVWIRLVYYRTEDEWKDADGKEILTVDNIHRSDSIEICTASKEGFQTNAS